MKEDCNKCFWQKDWHHPDGYWCYMFGIKPKNCRKYSPQQNKDRKAEALEKEAKNQ